MDFHHVSVLLNELVEGVFTSPDGIYVDCTLGGAGHSLALGKKLSKEGLLIGLDQDEEALSVATERLQALDCQVMTIRTNFQHLKEALLEKGITEVDGFMFDLGVSSYQLDTAERGFSYMQDGPLDMRMDITGKKTAADIVNHASAETLNTILKEYGEERWSKRIVEFIIAAREEKSIETTQELVSIIKKAIPAGARKDGPHPAKRTFQALRIAVNSELDILKDAFSDAVSLLKPGGKIGVITFHSLEDRITKQTFAGLAKGCVCPPNLPICACGKKPLIKGGNKAIEPSNLEVEENPRARSAKLRVAEKL